MNQVLKNSIRLARDRLSWTFNNFSQNISGNYGRCGLKSQYYLDILSGDRNGGLHLEKVTRKREFGDAMITMGAFVTSVYGLSVLINEPSEMGPPIEFEVGAPVMHLVEMSPFLREQLKDLQRHGWVVGYGDIEAAGLTLADVKKIIISNDVKSDPLLATAVLAHEVGHAYPGRFEAITDPPTPGEEYVAWLDRNMRMRYMAEAESGLVTAKVRQEILNNRGPDISNISDETIFLYNQMSIGSMTHDETRDRLTDEYSLEPYDHYRSELEEYWDENFADSHGPSEAQIPKEYVAPPEPNLPIVREPAPNE
ncbi:hypothetical protein [Nocardia sp. NPDC003963]